MASAYEKRRGRFYARWKDRHGVWQDTPTAARTKREANQAAIELEQRAWRQRMGLEQLASQDGSGTVRDLMTWWLETFSEGMPSHAKNLSTIENHLLKGKLADVRLAELTKGRIETFLDQKAKQGLSAQTVNHIRGYLSRAFTAGISRERWAGENPVFKTARRRGPKRHPDFLRLEEVAPVIAQVPPQHFHRFVTTLYTGLRKGELRALRKTDIDWSLKAIWVRRSGTRETTKGGHEEPISIHPDLELVLREAVEASPTELVFPGPDGGMLRDDFKFGVVLRRAMARAGIVEGFLHVCRRQGCRHEERAADDGERRCPEHGLPALAEAGRPPDHLPPPPPHGREPVPHGRRPARGGPADAPPHRPEDHLGRLRAPPAVLPAGGHRPRPPSAAGAPRATARPPPARARSCFDRLSKSGDSRTERTPRPPVC